MLVSTEKPGSPAEVLEHFGTKGMHWGVRKKQEMSSNGKSAQPKKLSERKEARAKKHEARASEAQKRINEIQAKPKTWAYAQYQRNTQVKELERFRDREAKAAKDIRAGRLTDFQKKAIIGASVVGVALAAYGTYKLVDSGTANQLLNRNTAMKTNDLLSRTMSHDAIMKEVVKPINPGYGGLGTKMNCRRCTFAYEMRRRGMDVKATNSVAGTGQTPLSLIKATQPGSKIKTGKVSMVKTMVEEAQVRDKWGRPTKGPVTALIQEGHGLGKEGLGESFKFDTPSAKSAKIFEALSRNPDGARGELGMSWKQGGAHSMAWEIIGGKPVIFDTQNGHSYTQAEFESVTKVMKNAASTRLDDVPLNTNFLGKWVRNVK